MNPLKDLTPREIVKALDVYIIGQEKAKKSVAIALRNRMRRLNLPDDFRDEIAPKNIIMIGPTGVGKTEIARRLSKLYGAPFIKVEATKYTEVGYVGRDVESMVRDLLSVAISIVKEELAEGMQEKADENVEEQLLDLLLPGVKPAQKGDDIIQPTGSDTREKFRTKLRNGDFENKVVEVSVNKGGFPAIEILGGNSLEEMDINFAGLGNIFGQNKKKKKVTIEQARKILHDQELDKLIDNDRAVEIAKQRVEEMGIIFIDEIDKIATKEGRQGGDVSRQGVQRDILPIVEGSKVNTKHGLIDTSHILFIAAGAFHISKPSDLIPELQGRFPLRVELNALSAEDFEKILTQPKNALTRQYEELLKTEEVTINFTDEAVKRISEIAAEVNSKSENIGARRLHTIMEILLEEVSFNAPEIQGQTIEITKAYVDERLDNIVQDEDLSQYIL